MTRSAIAFVVILCVAIMAAVLVPGRPKPQPPKPVEHYFTVPTFGDHAKDRVAPGKDGLSFACGADVTAKLQNYLNSLPPNSTATLPYQGCYTIDGTLQINAVTNLTIVGNGTTLDQSTAQACSGSNNPIVLLSSDTSVKMTNFAIIGGFTGNNGGLECEGAYGISMQDDNHITISGLTESDTQGDFFILQIAVISGDHGLNNNVSITNSTFDQSGYHGVTLEAANYVTISNDVFEHMPTDCMDFEYDGGATQIVNNKPTLAAEDNITVSNDTWTDWGQAWFDTGQTLGVQEQNVAFSNDRLSSTAYSEGTESASYLFTLEGANAATFTQPYLLLGMTFNNITTTKPLQSAYSSSPSIPNSGTLGVMQFAYNVSITNSNIQANVPSGYTPYLSLVKAQSTTNLTIQNNNVNNAYSIYNPHSSSNKNHSECGNFYGASLSETDSACS